jgi:hypothetical protein
VLETVAVLNCVNFTRTHPSFPVKAKVLETILISVGVTPVAVAVRSVPRPGVMVVVGETGVNVIPGVGVKAAQANGSGALVQVCALMIVWLKIVRIVANSIQTVEE